MSRELRCEKDKQTKNKKLNPKALAIDVLFRFFHFLGGIFNYF
jgi:hypothetical protein